MKPQDLVHPFEVQLNYFNSILSRSEHDVDVTLKTKLNEFDFTAGEIIFHGINALYRAGRLMENPALKFNEINIPRQPKVSPHDELLTLYRRAIDLLKTQLGKISLEDLDQDIISPLNRKPIKLINWIGTNTWHTIHHIGQGIRISGIVGREILDKTPNIEDHPNYRKLY